MAKYDEKAKARTMKYMKEKRDKLTLNLPLGDKERFKAYAESKGMSLTALITQLLEADMINEQKAAEPKKCIADIPDDEILERVKVIVNTFAGNEYKEVYTLDGFIEKQKHRDYYDSIEQREMDRDFIEHTAVDILNRLRHINDKRKRY